MESQKRQPCSHSSSAAASRSRLVQPVRIADSLELVSPVRAVPVDQGASQLFKIDLDCHCYPFLYHLLHQYPVDESGQTVPEGTVSERKVRIADDERGENSVGSIHCPAVGNDLVPDRRIEIGLINPCQWNSRSPTSVSCPFVRQYSFIIADDSRKPKYSISLSCFRLVGGQAADCFSFLAGRSCRGEFSLICIPARNAARSVPAVCQPVPGISIILQTPDGEIPGIPAAPPRIRSVPAVDNRLFQVIKPGRFPSPASSEFVSPGWLADNVDYN